MNKTQNSGLFLVDNNLQMSTYNQSTVNNSTIVRNFTMLSDSSDWSFSDVMYGFLFGGIFGFAGAFSGCGIAYMWVRCSDNARAAGRLIEDYDEGESAKGACKCCGFLMGTISAIIGFTQSKKILTDTNKKNIRLLTVEDDSKPLDQDYYDVSLQI